MVAFGRCALLVACVGSALSLAACDQLDRRYFREGVGTELHEGDATDSIRLQEIYFGHLCQRAGLSFADTNEGLPSCDYRAITPQSWMLIVQTGMNDIDQRCDAYLSWLDARKRFSTAYLQQLSDTRTAVEAILAVTGVGPKSIAIVGTAFGLATATFTNLNSRLLLEVEQSTVQSVVLSRQTEFREKLPRVIDNKAAAVYALRSYLRLCMPMTIETQINTTVKLFERGGLPALEEAQARPMIDAQAVTTANRVRFTPVTPLTTRILRFWNSSANNKAAVEGWLTSNNINMPVGLFVRSQAHAAQWPRIVRDLGIP
jgi:hypothetical protein